MANYIQVYMTARYWNATSGDSGNYEPGAWRWSTDNTNWSGWIGQTSYPYELYNGNSCAQMHVGEQFYLYARVDGLENTASDVFDVSVLGVNANTGVRTEPNLGVNSRSWNLTGQNNGAKTVSGDIIYLGQFTTSSSAGYDELVSFWCNKGASGTYSSSNQTGSFVWEALGAPATPTSIAVSYATTESATTTATFSASNLSNSSYGTNTDTSASAASSYSASNTVSVTRGTSYKYFVRNSVTNSLGSALYATGSITPGAVPYISAGTCTVSSSSFLTSNTHTVTISRSGSANTIWYAVTSSSSYTSSTIKGRTYSGASTLKSNTDPNADVAAGAGTYYLWHHLPTSNGGAGTFVYANVSYTITDTSDTVPNAFNFGNNVTNANTSQVYTSSVATISGLDAAASISCDSGAEYRINSGSWSSSSQSAAVSNNDEVAIRFTSSSSANTAISKSVTIGGVESTDWTVTTGSSGGGSGGGGSGDYGLVIYNADGTSQILTPGMKVTNYISVSDGSGNEINSVTIAAGSSVNYTIAGLTANNDESFGTIVSTNNGQLTSYIELDYNQPSTGQLRLKNAHSSSSLTVYFWVLRYD